jgi:hypothetical protein
LGTEVIDIFVGPERKRYVVHKQPLTSKSEYFRTVFKGGFKEAEENSIHLREEDPAAVALMIGWVYRGVIPGMERKISPFAQPYAPNPLQKSDIPNANSIDGSRYPFAPYYEVEPNSSSGMRNAFQNIGFQPQYQMFSQEELRVADYRSGRRYPDANPAPRYHGHGHGLFGFVPPGAQPVIPPPPPPANAPAPVPPSQPGNMFGTVQPAPAPPTANMPPAPTPSSQLGTGNIFGTVQQALPSLAGAPIAAPSSRLWASSWGQQPQPATSLFGVPLPPPQTGSGTSLFGNARPAPAAPSTQNGGSTINSTPTQPDQGTSASSTPATTQTAPPAPAQGTGLFPSLNPSPSGQAPTGDLFAGLGSNIAPSVLSHRQQTGSLFGNFGHSHPTGGLFGSTTGSLLDFGGFSPIRPNGFNRDDLRPGSFGYTSTIEYPKASGTPLPGIPQSQPLGARSAEQEAQQSALLHLCLLAETILWPELYNAAIEAYVRGELNLHRPIPAEHVDLIYDRTPSESTLRAYVLESMCTNRGDSLMYIELTRQYDELMEDILNKLPTLRVQEQQAPWTQDDLIRSFHMPKLSTGKGKEKEGKDVEVGGVLTEKEDSAST